jgi:FkbM family methyltransferase
MLGQKISLLPTAAQSTKFDLRSLTEKTRSDSENHIRSLCRSVYLGDSEAMCICLGRYKMFVDTRDFGFAPHMLLDGFWEFWITQFIYRTVKPDMITMDVGANFGYYTVLMADLVGPNGKCLAVEPNPYVAEKLARTLAVNGFQSRAPLTRAALFDSERDDLLFFMPSNEPKNGRIVSEAFTSGDGVTAHVTGTTLDTLSENLPKLDFIKIDAEGGEAGIVSGMKNTLQRLRPTILLEYNSARPDVDHMLDVLFDYTNNHMAYVDFDGQSKPVSRDRLLNENVGNDWMLHIVPH